MKPHTLYEILTGKIVRTVYLPENRQPTPKPGMLWMEGEYSDETQYAPNGEVAMRPRLGLTVVDAHVSNIPHGATVRVNGYAMPYGTTEFTATSAQKGASVEVTVELWPYQTERFSVIAEQEESEAST